MRFDSISDWSKHYLAKVESKLHILPGTECKLWTGGPKTGMYGKIKVYFPTNGTTGGIWSPKTVRVHRLVYMLNIPAFNIEPQDYHVSHVCHQSKCCDINHLSLEPCSTNMQRKTCKTEKCCLGHTEFKDCLYVR